MKTQQYTRTMFILTILFFVIITFTESNAQVVTLPEKTARFYFERHYRAKALDEIVNVKIKQISNLQSQLLLRDSVIDTYKKDQKVYTLVVDTKTIQTKALEADLKAMKKEAKKQKFEKKIVMVVGVVLLTLSLIYQ